jgi:hypothetical protein
MPTEPGEDEHRIRRALDARGVGYAPQPPSGPVRPRDWLDDLMDDQPEPRAAPPAPPEPPKSTTTDTPGEPRWDWRRLLHWPYARLCSGATAALIPWYHGQSAATGWGSVLHSYRTGAGTGAAWIVAGIGLAVAAVLVHRRRTWWTYTLLTTAFIGTVAMASPFDLVTLITGVTK